jgi:hypothetical protein
MEVNKTGQFEEERKEMTGIFTTTSLSEVRQMYDMPNATKGFKPFSEVEQNADN